jgi:hypothetical protein
VASGARIGIENRALVAQADQAGCTLDRALFRVALVKTPPKDPAS